MGHYVVPPLQEDYPTSPPPPPRKSPPADEPDIPTGAFSLFSLGNLLPTGDLLHLGFAGSAMKVGNPFAPDRPDAQGDPLIDVSGDAGGLLAFAGTGDGLLATGDLLHLPIGGSTLEVGNPLAPDCPDMQGKPLIDLTGDGAGLLSLAGGGTHLLGGGDLLHAGTDGDTALKIGNPFASSDPDADPLIDLSGVGLPLNNDDGGSTLLAGLLGTGSDTAASASSLLSGLFGSGDAGGEDGCGCGGILLQPVLDLAFESLDCLHA